MSGGESIEFKLESFEGPLDLLLHLIRTNELDIFDIPIVDITEQYLEYIELMKTVDIDIGSEFMVMAATLIHIKTKMLLPRDDSEEDPRQELVERLLEHKQYKEAAGMLEKREASESRVWRTPPARQRAYVEVDEEFVEVDIFQLISAFQEVLRSIGHIDTMEVEHQKISVEEKMKELTALIHQREKMLFSTMIQEVATKREIITVFLALLELVRGKVIVAFQNRNFGEIVIIHKDRAQRVLKIQ